MNTIANECQYCGTIHAGKCPLVSAIEYHPDGSTKRVEFYPPEPIVSALGQPISDVRMGDVPIPPAATIFRGVQRGPAREI